MAIEKVIDIKVQGNVDQAVGSLRSQLRAAQQEVAALSDKFGATSAEAVNAAKRAGELKDRIGDAKALTDAFNPDAKFKALTSSLSGVAAGFSAYQGALNLAGVENKNLEESLLKVQSAMALSQGLQALGESRDSFKQLKAVAVDALKGIKAGIGATGIGLLVVALGTIAANWEDIVIAAKEAFPALNNVGNVFNKLKEYAFGAGNVIKNYILMPFKALGQLIAGDFKGAIEEIKKGFDVVGNYEAGAAKERQNQRDEAAAEQLAKLVKDNENRIAVLKASGKDTYSLELENLKNKQKLYKDDQEKLDQALQDERVLRATHGKQLTDAQAAINKKLAEEQYAARQKEAEELAELQKKKVEKIQEDFDNLYKANQDANQLIAESTMTREEIELAAIDKKYQDQIALATKLGQDTTTLTDAFALERTGVMQKYASEEDKIREEQKVKDEELAKANIQLAEKEAAAKQAIFAKTASVLSQGADLLGKNTAAGKAMAIAAATINTYQGITAELATKTVTPFEIGLKIANVAIIAATGFKAVKDIISVKVPGGGGGGAAPSMSAMSGAGGANAPQFNVVGSTGVNQLAGAIGNREAAPVQAYVVANNVTTAQSLDRNIISSATLGG
jgi:hypothetical protein